MFRAAAALLAMLPARALDEDSPHGLRSSGEEMRPIGKDSIAQAKPGFVHQRGRLKRVSWLFPRHLGRRQAPQFGVDERQQFIRSTGLALLQGAKNACDFAHPRRYLTYGWLLVKRGHSLSTRLRAITKEVCGARNG
jgi:hypothetical protein